MNPLDRLTALGTSVWVDALVGPVQLERLTREDGVTGLTSNPTILDHALTGGEAYQVRAGLRTLAAGPFSLEAYAGVVEAYTSGLEARLRAGRPADRIFSVASFFVSRVDTAVDAMLAERGHTELEGLAAVANARLAYALAQQEFTSERFAKLRAAGAHQQRLLWASTGTKDPRYSDVKHVDELAGPGVINTMPLATLAAFHDHGDPVDRLTDSAAAAKATLDAVRAAGVDLDSVTHQLLEDGVARFAASMDDLLLNLNNAALAA
jgi:transaldolase